MDTNNVNIGRDKLMIYPAQRIKLFQNTIFTHS